MDVLAGFDNSILNWSPQSAQNQIHSSSTKLSPLSSIHLSPTLQAAN
jgi:hypothetical protein